MPEILVRRYCTVGGAEPFTEWLAKLKDRKAHARILARIEVLALGSLGDAKALREGVAGRRVGAANRRGSRLPRLLRTGRQCGGDPVVRRRQAEAGRGHQEGC